MAEIAREMEYYTDKVAGMIKPPLLRRSSVSGGEASLMYRKMESYCAFQTCTLSLFLPSKKVSNIEGHNLADLVLSIKI